jgi:uncharacterized protein YsxB (DUF464 family)
MSDPNLESYVGMVTGIIGAITGITGAILGYIGYRKTNEIKSIDLRLELRKGISEVEVLLSKTEELLPYANKSRQRVSAALGSFQSGAMVKWSQDYESDLALLRELSNKKPIISNPESLSQNSLEQEIINFHGLQLQLKELNEKYTAHLQSDEKDRDRLRSEHQ